MTQRDPPSTSELLRRLATRDTPCPRCRYNLRGLDSPVCPECGESISMSLIANAAPAPPSFAWWFGALGLLLGVVASLIVVFISDVLTQWINPPAPVGRLIFTLLVAAAVVEWGLVFFWLRPRSVARLPAWRQWSLAAFAWWPQVALVAAMSRMF